MLGDDVGGNLGGQRVLTVQISFLPGCFALLDKFNMEYNWYAYLMRLFQLAQQFVIGIQFRIIQIDIDGNLGVL